MEYLLSLENEDERIPLILKDNYYVDVRQLEPSLEPKSPKRVFPKQKQFVENYDSRKPNWAPQSGIVSTPWMDKTQKKRIQQKRRGSRQAVQIRLSPRIQNKRVEFVEHQTGQKIPKLRHNYTTLDLQGGRQKYKVSEQYSLILPKISPEKGVKMRGTRDSSPIKRYQNTDIVHKSVELRRNSAAVNYSSEEVEKEYGGSRAGGRSALADYHNISIRKKSITRKFLDSPIRLNSGASRAPKLQRAPT